MYFLISFYIFIFGTLIGSFLNVVILRYNTGKKILGIQERSMCFSCSKKLEWYELVPVLSFVFLRAKCAGCKSRISWQYPLVELAMGLLTLGIFYKNFHSVFASRDLGWITVNVGFIESLAVLTLLEMTIWAILLVITAYDLRHKIIPDGLAFAFAALAFVIAILDGRLSNSLIAGALFFAFFASLWLVSGGRWLGFGDAKLVVGVGFLLGITNGLSALTLAFWIGAAVGIFLILVGRIATYILKSKKIGWLKIGRLKTIRAKVVRWRCLRSCARILTMKSEIPFAPFIILGTLIAFFCQIDIFGIGALFF